MFNYLVNYFKALVPQKSKKGQALVEYALIIALVSIALIIALGTLAGADGTTGIGKAFKTIQNAL